MSAAIPERIRSGTHDHRTRLRLTPRAAVLALVLAVLLLGLVVPLKTFLQQRGQLARLQQQERVLEQQNASLQTQVRRLHEPAYLEQLARQCLGMVRPGEIGFTLAGTGAQASTSSPGMGQAAC